MSRLDNSLKRIISGLAELSPSCRTAARLQSEALDHKLTLRQRWGLRIHLALCKWCSRYGKQIAFIREAAHSRPDGIAQSAPEKLSDEASERIRKKLRVNIK